MAFLSIFEVTKRYGDFTAVSGFSLSVERGEFVCLLGPSGCGKTTILQMISGFVVPSAGRIELDGRDMTSMKPNRRGLGIVFQSYALFPHMTVAQNVAFGLEMQKVRGRERATRVAESLEQVHLGPMAGRYPRELSGGQRQRVALARAIVIRPPVLLLDEPMGALDAKLRESMQLELRALQRRVGITTVMVTHDQAEAMTLADRVVLMKQGSIEQIGRPFDLYDQPNGRFSSTFLGKANVFAGLLHNGAFETAGHSLPVGTTCATGEVDYIVRPEKIAFTQKDAVVSGRITACAFLGNHWLFQVETCLGTIQLTQVNDGPPRAAEGDHVGMTWQSGSVRIVARGEAP